MQNIFGVPRIITYSILIVSFVLMIGMTMVGLRDRSDLKYYQIITPDGKYFMTSEIFEEGGCVKFKDSFGIEYKICGSYRLTKF